MISSSKGVADGTLAMGLRDCMPSVRTGSSAFLPNCFRYTGDTDLGTKKAIPSEENPVEADFRDPRTEWLKG